MVVPLLARRVESLGFVAQRSWVSVMNGSGEGKREGGFGCEEERMEMKKWRKRSKERRLRKILRK